MRGAHGAPRNRPHRRRIIPADAGSTKSCRLSKVDHTDHPRGCGEHQSQPIRKDRAQGSSPRMRGAQPDPGVQKFQQRIIPADAGSTSVSPCRRAATRDHPRGCGEHDVPPADPQVLPGIIPADAGSTKVRPGLPDGHRDHPRGCGEHFNPDQFDFEDDGDHPRGCGEHVPGLASNRILLGSSPRMRGAQSLYAMYVIGKGIIPADAGSTPGPRSMYYPEQDHPRGCGEHRYEHAPDRCSDGSSPRMRGALDIYPEF